MPSELCESPCRFEACSCVVAPSPDEVSEDEDPSCEDGSLPDPAAAAGGVPCREDGPCEPPPRA